MVAKIKEPKNFRKAIYYNEHKVNEGKAECIAAGNFLKTAADLSLFDKMQRFKSLIQLNEGITYNTLHISLNFHPSERFSRDRLIEIAGTYLEKIGFGDQPFLVYRHDDTFHPHVHIVTTTIREDGTSIDINYIGRDRSEPARKEIEIAYGLVQAEGRRKSTEQNIKPLDAQRLRYGKSETKRGITNVLGTVLQKYVFSSLAELNAILSLYNVRADRGAPGSRSYERGGLLYQILDDQGNPVGIPIKASAIYSKPTLAFLTKEFEKHMDKPPIARKKLKHTIDLVLHAKPGSLDDFVRQLRNEQIHVVPRRNKEGVIYGLTFVDTRNKVVFNGSDIHKDYTALHLLTKLGLDAKLNPLPPAEKAVRQPTRPATDLTPSSQLPLPFASRRPGTHSSSRKSLEPDETQFHSRSVAEEDQTPIELSKDKKKRRNQKPNH